MEIERQTLGEIEVLIVKGEMLIGEGNELLRETIDDCIESGAKKVLIDLGECPFVDSSSLCELIRSYTSLSRADGMVALLNISERLDALLEITKLKSIFPVFASKEEALRTLRDDSRKERR
jgi:anti-sigma B factor antagonist